MAIRATGVLLMGMFLAGCLAGCTGSIGNEYYKARDENVVAVLELCTQEQTPMFKEGTTVKDLAAGYVGVKGSLLRCQAYSEEVVKLLSRE